MAAQYDRATPEEGNVTQRHGLLPLATYNNGMTGLAFPGFVAEPVESFNRLLQNGYQGGTGDIRGVEDAFNVAGAAMMGGFAAPKPRNVVGSAGGDLKGAALGAIPDTPGIRAYHGSPHDFDKFDLSKIGTGEGAQAYGHGLYFAENEGVAKTYRDTTSGKNANIAVQTNGVRQLIGMLQKNPPELEQALRNSAAHMKASGTDAGRIAAQEAIAVADSIRDGTFKAGSGRMYEVNIKANPDDFLDWDKPLSQQSAGVRDAINRVGRDAEPYGLDRITDDMRPVEMSKLFRDPVAIERLKQHNVPGIRYLDQGSRAGGEGSRNLVVFDDKLIEILRKYGLLGMAGGAAAAEYGGNSLMPSSPASPRYRPGDA